MIFQYDLSPQPSLSRLAGERSVDIFLFCTKENYSKEHCVDSESMLSLNRTTHIIVRLLVDNFVSLITKTFTFSSSHDWWFHKLGSSSLCVPSFCAERESSLCALFLMRFPSAILINFSWSMIQLCLNLCFEWKNSFRT